MIADDVIDGDVVIKSKQNKIMDITKHDLRNRCIVLRLTYDGEAGFSSHDEIV